MELLISFLLGCVCGAAISRLRAKRKARAQAVAEGGGGGGPVEPD